MDTLPHLAVMETAVSTANSSREEITPPRYDDVFDEGMAVLDAEDAANDLIKDHAAYFAGSGEMKKWEVEYTSRKGKRHVMRLPFRTGEGAADFVMWIKNCSVMGVREAA